MLKVGALHKCERPGPSVTNPAGIYCRCRQAQKPDLAFALQDMQQIDDFVGHVLRRALVQEQRIDMLKP